MFRKCNYDEVKDLKDVNPLGWLDVAEAVRNGYVPGSINTEDMVYNGIEDPASILGYADDAFSLMRQGDYVKSFSSKTARPEDGAPTE